MDLYPKKIYLYLHRGLRSVIIQKTSDSNKKGQILKVHLIFARKRCRSRLNNNLFIKTSSFDPVKSNPMKLKFELN